MIRIQNNGHFSREIEVSRSVHQGGPASNALFLVVAELLAICIRSDSEVRGTFVKEVLHLLNQFADDMDVFQDFDQQSFSKLLQHFERFQNSTGFALNYDKTAVYRIGSLQKTNAKLYSLKPLKWTSEPITVLGVKVCGDTHELIDINYQEIILKARKVLDCWTHRNVSLYGKVNIINTLIASLFVYKMSVLPKLPAYMVKQLEDMFVKFLWNGHKPKIPLEILKSPKRDGGLQLVDLSAKDDAIKCSWVQMVVKNVYPSEFVYNILGSVLKENIWTCNFAPQDTKSVFPGVNDFWTDVLTAWAKIHYDSNPARNLFLWHNSLIKAAGETIMYEEAYKQGLQHCDQLYEDGALIEINELCARYKMSVMQANTLISAIPKETKKYVSTNPTCPYTDPKFAAFMSNKNPTQYAYLQICPTSMKIGNRTEKLEYKIADGEEVDIIEETKRLRSCTVIAKYRSFQYRTLMGAIITNIDLQRWGIRENNMCSLCGCEPESTRHLMYECTEVQILWQKVSVIAQNWGAEIKELTYRAVILNRIAIQDNGIVNFLCLITKQYIYRQRCLAQKVSASELANIIYKQKNIEKYYAVKNATLPKFIKRWERNSVQSSDIDDEEFLQQISLSVDA